VASHQRRWRLLFWCAVVAGVVLALWPHPDPPDPWFPGADKVEHALSFALLMWIGGRAGYRDALRLAIGLLMLGAAIEIAQSFTATRTAEWLDWLADAVGIVIGHVVERLTGRPRDARSLGLEQEHGR